MLRRRQSKAPLPISRRQREKLKRDLYIKEPSQWQRFVEHFLCHKKVRMSAVICLEESEVLGMWTDEKYYMIQTVPFQIYKMARILSHDGARELTRIIYPHPEDPKDLGAELSVDNWEHFKIICNFNNKCS